MDNLRFLVSFQYGWPQFISDCWISHLVLISACVYHRCHWFLKSWFNICRLDMKDTLCISHLPIDCSTHRKPFLHCYINNVKIDATDERSHYQKVSQFWLLSSDFAASYGGKHNWTLLQTTNKTISNWNGKNVEQGHCFCVREWLQRIRFCRKRGRFCFSNSKKAVF